MRKLIQIPIWNRKLLVITPPSDLLRNVRRFKMGKHLIKEIKYNPPVESDGACTYTCDDYGLYVLWLPNKKVSLGVIIHETNHITKHMMKYIGAQQEHEGHAYTQEWLIREIKKALR